MMTKWQIVLDKKLDKLLLSSKVLKSSVKSLHRDFKRLDNVIDSLEVNIENNVMDQDIPTQLDLSDFEDNFYDDFVVPDFYYLRFRSNESIYTMPHVFIV